jgi:hypothetical protein
MGTFALSCRQLVAIDFWQSRAFSREGATRLARTKGHVIIWLNKGEFCDPPDIQTLRCLTQWNTQAHSIRLRDAVNTATDVLDAIVSLYLMYRRDQDQGNGNGQAGIQCAQDAHVLNVDLPQQLGKLRMLFNFRPPNGQ